MRITLYVIELYRTLKNVILFNALLFFFFFGHNIFFYLMCCLLCMPVATTVVQVQVLGILRPFFS